MAEEVNGNAPIEETSIVSMCSFKCGSCQGPMVARTPPMRVFNFPESSGIIIPHERMAKCPNCSTIYVPLVKEVSQDGKIQLVWKPLQTKDTAIAGSSFADMSKAKKQ